MTLKSLEEYTCEAIGRLWLRVLALEHEVAVAKATAPPAPTEEADRAAKEN